MSERPLWRMVAGRKAGPYDPAKLRPLVKDGRVGPLDRFSYDGVNWQPANAFPELLRPPPVVTAAPVEDDFSPFSAKPGAAGDGDLLGPPSLTGRQQPSGDDAALIKAIYLLIAFGGGLALLLLIYIVVQSLRGPSLPPRPAANQPARSRQEQPRRPAVSASREEVVDATETPREDGGEMVGEAGSLAESEQSEVDSRPDPVPAGDAGVSNEIGD
jgi:hypothetical protein